MAKARAMVVGAGGISRPWFAALVKAKAPIAAVVDLRLEAARERIAQFAPQAEASTDLKAMLRKHRPDFIIDATAPEAHCQVACAAMEHGAHVLGEKPMASSLAEARKMVRTAERTGRLYMIDQSHRWVPSNDRVRKAVAAGRIGPLTTINCQFYVATGGHAGFRALMPSPLLFDMAIHHFDLARMFSGADPVSVYAHEFNPANSTYKGNAAATCIFEMAGGVVFTYCGSWAAEGLRTPWPGAWRLIGTRGTIVHEGEPRGQALVGRPKPGQKRMHKDIVIPPPSFRDEFMDAALREMLAFLRSGRRPQAECHDNIKSLAMVFAAIESARKGRRVPVTW